jgi:endonuclease VIII
VPEGDTIYRVAAALRAALLGKSLLSFETTRYFGVRPQLGSVIERVDSSGKHLEIGWDDGTVLHTHLRMNGSWQLYRVGETWSKPPKQARVVITVEGFEAACFNAPIIETYRSHDYYWHPGQGRLGPDLCKPPVNVDDCVYRIDRFCEPDRTVAETLLDQRIACGVGNVFKSEILWACGVHPDTCIGAIDDHQRAFLITTAARFLQANLDLTQRTTIAGVPGGLAVYGRYRKPCAHCGESIEVARHGENARVTYWCPGCQLYIPMAQQPAPAPEAKRSGPRWFGRSVSAPEPMPEHDEVDPHPVERILVPAGRVEPPQFHDPLLARAARS